MYGIELALLFGTSLWTVNGLLTSSGSSSYPAMQHPYGRNYFNKQDAFYSEAVMMLFGNFARSG